MRNPLAALFAPQANETIDPAQRERISSAVLLLEMAHADFDLGHDEQAHIHSLLASHYELSDDAVTQLLHDAGQTVQQSASLYDYLKTINDQHSAEDKAELLQMIWQVAYADGRLDPKEEALVRRIADLLYLPHAVFIKTKLSVLEARELSG